MTRSLPALSRRYNFINTVNRHRERSVAISTRQVNIKLLSAWRVEIATLVPRSQ
jgi:hypothetical protein